MAHYRKNFLHRIVILFILLAGSRFCSVCLQHLLGRIRDDKEQCNENDYGHCDVGNNGCFNSIFAFSRILECHHHQRRQHDIEDADAGFVQTVCSPLFTVRPHHTNNLNLCREVEHQGCYSETEPHRNAPHVGMGIQQEAYRKYRIQHDGKQINRLIVEAVCKPSPKRCQNNISQSVNGKQEAHLGSGNIQEFAKRFIPGVLKIRYQIYNSPAGTQCQHSNCQPQLTHLNVTSIFHYYSPFFFRTIALIRCTSGIHLPESGYRRESDCPSPW